MVEISGSTIYGLCKSIWFKDFEYDADVYKFVRLYEFIDLIDHNDVGSKYYYQSPNHYTFVLGVGDNIQNPVITLNNVEFLSTNSIIIYNGETYNPYPTYANPRICSHMLYNNVLYVTVRKVVINDDEFLELYERKIGW